MEIDRDPTDLGIRYAWDPDEEPVDLSELFAPAPSPPVPAGPEQRAAARAIAGLVPSPRPSLEAACCSCGAGPTRWCRRAGREVVGFVHPSR